MRIYNNTYSPVTIFVAIGFILSNYSYSQNGIAFGSEYKKELWKKIDPSKKTPLNTSKPLELPKKDENILQNKYGSYYSNLKNNNKLDHLFEITKTPYVLSPNLLIYNGKIPLNQLPAGSTTLMFLGGHFYQVSNAGKNVVPSGLNISGGGTKKLSEKSKNILINVFGLEIDE